MATKEDLKDWTVEVLRASGGELHHIDVAKAVWSRREEELRLSGDLFFTWQYDLRWAAYKLRDSGVLRKMDGRGDGRWRLA